MPPHPLHWLAMATTIALLGSGCATERPPATPAIANVPQAAVADLATDLLDAEPADWLPRLQALLQAGEAAANPLLAALQRRPDAVGAEAAVAALGRLGSPVPIEWLAEQVAERSPLATAAALALGELADSAAAGPASLAELPRGALWDCLRDRYADATLRTAAAASLLRLGERSSLAEFVSAIVLAGTPAGQPAAQRLGLPDKQRWAHERYLLQRALLRAAGDRFGLETDASFADLERCAQRITAWLQSAATDGTSTAR